MRVASSVVIVCCVAATAVAVPDDVAAELKSVATMRSVGEIEAAAAAAATLVAKHPESIEAHIVHQDLELALGHDKELVRAYRAPLAAPGATADAHFLCGRVLRGGAAASEFREALKADPAHFSAACCLALELIRSKSFAEAKDLLDAAAKRRPTSAVPVNALGRLEEARGKYAEAEKHYRAALALDADMIVARVNLGAALIAMGKVADGRAELESAALAAPNDPSPLIELGMSYRAANDEKLATEAFQRAASTDTMDVTALNVLGIAYLSIDEIRLAESVLTRAQKAAPGCLATKVNLSYLSVKQGQTEDAVKFATEAVAGDDRMAEAHFALAMALERVPELKRADAEYRRAAQLDPDNPEFARGGATFAASTGDWPRAIAEFSRAARLTGNAPEILLELAAAYSGGQKPSEAAATYDKVVDVDPKNLDAWFQLGVVSARDLGQKKRAAKAFREYLDRGGTDARVAGWIQQLEAKQ